MIRELARIIRKFKKVAPKYRSAITGRYVSKAYAEANPQTTVKEIPRR